MACIVISLPLLLYSSSKCTTTGTKRGPSNNAQCKTERTCIHNWGNLNKTDKKKKQEKKRQKRKDKNQKKTFDTSENNDIWNKITVETIFTIFVLSSGLGLP